MNAQQLKNSILQMAVQGKLVPQDPNDEPASVLLERIRAEKEKLIKEGKIKKEKNPSIIFRGEDNLPYEKVGKNELVCIADEVPFEIPDSWEWARLGTVVFNHGQKQPISIFSYIDIGSIDNNNQTLNSKESFVEAESAPSRARKIVMLGDILYSTVRPYLHNMCIVNREFAHEPIASTGFAVLACHADLYNQYLFYFLMSPSFDSYANDTENSKGVAYPAINDDRLYKALIPIPPVKEQYRIIDLYLSLAPYIMEYDKAETKLSRLNAIFPEMLKKSILQQAVMGKLVPQDPNDEPASVLLEKICAEKDALIKAGKLKKDKHESIIYRRDNSHYEKINGNEVCIDDEIPFDLPPHWSWERLTNIYNFIDYRGSTPTKINNGVPLITAKNVKKGYIDYSVADYISEAEYNNRQSRGISHKGDILFTTEAPLGNVAIADLDRYSAGQRLITFQQFTSIEYLDNNLMLAFLMSPFFQEQLKQKSTGTTVKGIKADKLKRLLIPVPPLAEQRRLYSKILITCDLTNTL